MNRAGAMAVLAAAVVIAAVSSLIGASSRIVEDDQGGVIDCGPTLFQRGDEVPPTLCGGFDGWQYIAAAGLLLATCVAVIVVVHLVRAAVGRRANPPAWRVTTKS